MRALLGMPPCMYYSSKVQEMMMAPHMHVIHARGTFEERNLLLERDPELWLRCILPQKEILSHVCMVGEICGLQGMLEAAACLRWT
jgi:hypothetical protein